MENVTLKQLAKTLNISVATVSKALKNYPDVSNETRQKVLDLAEKLNYVPNSFAVSFRTQKSKIIGVIIPATVHHFFSNVIQGILEESEKRDYLVILMQSNENYELEKKQIDLLLSKGVDGILISLSNKTNTFSHLNKVIEQKVPLILFDKIAKNVNCSQVVIDDKKAAYDAVSFLIQKGYKRIAHFRGDLNPQNSIDRFLGYKQALIDHNIAFDSSLVYLCNNNDDFEDGYYFAKKLVEDHGTSVDAIFTITDVIAIGIMKYFNEHGIKVPDDIALFGFSNWFMASVMKPGLSSVEQYGYNMGATSIQVLFHEIDCKHKHLAVVPQKIILPTKLIIRESC